MPTYHQIGINESLYVHGTNAKHDHPIASMAIGKRCDYPDYPDFNTGSEKSRNDSIFFKHKNTSTLVFHKVESIDLMIEELKVLKHNFIASLKKIKS